jgi:hypothetical protein
MKTNILSVFLKRKLHIIFICLFVFGSLHAQRTITQEDVANLNTADVTIDAGSDDVTVGAITMQNNSSTAHTLTIKTTGNITVNGDINLSGIDGNPINYTVEWDNTSGNRNNDGRNGHNLVIEVGDNLTVSGIINTSGGKGAKSNAKGHFSHDIRKGGNAGNAGNVTINANLITITSEIIANGGLAGGTNIADGPMKGVDGGNGGNVIINSNTYLTVNSISVNGENGESNWLLMPVGAGGSAGNIVIEAAYNINVVGTVSANAGNAGFIGDSQPSGTIDNVPMGVDGGNILIRSNDGGISIGGNITAIGGNGAGQEATCNIPPYHTRGSTDGGAGGKVEIYSCSDLFTKAEINVNGGLPGTPHNVPRYQELYNLAGFGGVGGNVTLTSTNGNIITARIQANGADGANISIGMHGDNSGNKYGYADHGGNGGNGGKITITAITGTLSANSFVTTNGGKGGDYYQDACGGNGGNGGIINLQIATGNQNAMKTLLLASEGNKGENTPVTSQRPNDTAQCTGQNGIIGTINIEIQPYNGPTISCGNTTPPTCTLCPGSFAPIPGKEYVINGWVKDAGLYNSNEEIITYSHSISVIVDIAGQLNETVLGDFVPEGSIIDGWQRIYGEFMVPQNAYKIRIKLKNNTGGNEVYFDDVRVHPVDGSMKSYVYDPETLRLVAELDDENYATFYEYDEEGALIRIKKETERGVMTIQEARQGKVKNFNQ